MATDVSTHLEHDQAVYSTSIIHDGGTKRRSIPFFRWIKMMIPSSLIVVSMTLMVLLLPLTISTPKEGGSDPSVEFVQIGLGGSIESDVLTADLTGDGKMETLLGTSRGLYVISRGSLHSYIPTSSSVVDVALLDDVTGDGMQEVVLVVGDTSFPNIRCHDGVTSERVWQFVPKQEVFLQNLMWTEQQTLTFDVETTDVNSDNFDDVVATSGYYVYAIDGRTGKEIWRHEAENNLWKVAVVPDLDGDGNPDLTVGGQNGNLYVLNGRDGAPIWQSGIVERCNVTNEKGKLWAVIDRSVWDMVPMDIRDRPKAVISSEDGKVRLIDLADGSVDWEVLLIEYVDALLFKYYQQKSKQPTGPWDENFFNLEVSLTPDVTGDDVQEILASIYIGRRRVTGEETRRSGLFLINSITGRILWKNTGLSLEHVERVEATLLGGEKVLLLPSGKSGYAEQVEVIDLEDGMTLRTIKIESGPETFWQNEYSVKKFDDGSFLLVSDFGDLLCVSTSGEVLWDYPRITQVDVERGDFTGDETQDLLIISRSYQKGLMFQPRARVLYVIDGSTKEKAWSYEMPYEDYVAFGGISSITVTPDASGDGKQDIAGFLQPPQISGEMPSGEDSRVLLLSGRDGAILLKQQVPEQTYYGVWEKLYNNWSLIAERLRDSFEMDLESSLATEFERQSQDRRDQFEGELKQELDQMRQQGAGQQELDAYEEERKQQLEIELEEMKAQMEREWRQHFEEVDLPQQLVDWRNRLDDEEEGHKINKWIMSLDVIQNPNVEGGMAFLVGTQNDVFIIDREGGVLWNRTYGRWTYADPFGEGYDEMMMVFGLIPENAGDVFLQVAGDLNGDGIDDLVAIIQRRIMVGLSELTNGELDFSDGPIIELEMGVDPSQVNLVDDLDGDGVDEIYYSRSQENQPPIAIVTSPATGKKLLETEDCDPEATTLDLGCADLDGDGYGDTLVFRRFGERRSLEVMSGRAGDTIWESDSFDEPTLFSSMNYRGPVMPGTPISDVSGDGVPDLASVNCLIYQSGAIIMVHDVVDNDVVKEIVLEEIDQPKGRQHVHPGLAIGELGDFNGDGTRELAVSVALGESEEKKEFRLLIVDILNEEVIADFRILASAFIDLGSRSEFGAVGLSGEIYFLDVASNLMITSPAAGDTMVSPLRIEWTGVAAGSFNQVFIDGVEVGRTNENEFTVPVAEGEHVLTIRSIDEYGRGTYQTVDFVVQKKSSAATWAIALLVALAIVVALPSVTGYVTLHERRKRHG